MVFRIGNTYWMKRSPRSEETKIRIAEKMKGKFIGTKNPMFGGKHTEETRKKISEKAIGRPSPNKGRIASEESKQKISETLKGHIPWNKGKKGCQVAWNKGIPRTEEVKQKLSVANKGKKHTLEAKMKMAQSHKGKEFSKEHNMKIAIYRCGQKHTEATKQKISLSKKGTIPWNTGKHHSKETLNKLSGSNASNWNGGKRLANARRHNKKRERGFILIVNNNPYNEPIEYHHIHPNLPYVVPCPKRIHIMFPGVEKTHYLNVNAMLGFKIEGI